MFFFCCCRCRCRCGCGCGCGCCCCCCCCCGCGCGCCCRCRCRCRCSSAFGWRWAFRAFLFEAATAEFHRMPLDQVQRILQQLTEEQQGSLNYRTYFKKPSYINATQKPSESTKSFFFLPGSLYKLPIIGESNNANVW